MPHTYKMGDFDLTVESIVLVHRCTFAYGINTSDYREGRGVAGRVLCLSGKGRYVFEDACGKSEQLLAPGQMLFLPTDSRYVVTSAGKEPFCHITANFTLSQTHAEPDTAFDAILHNRLHHMSDVKNAAAVEELLERLLAVWQSKAYGYAVLARSILYEALYFYFADAVHSTGSGDDYRKILPAKSFLDTKYTEDCSIAELAAMCRLSQTHFRRLFARLFGCSPGHYRLQKRLQKAKDLLLSGEYTVAETARTVGFDDANYFGRVFRTHFGYSPSEAFKEFR